MTEIDWLQVGVDVTTPRGIARVNRITEDDGVYTTLGNFCRSELGEEPEVKYIDSLTAMRDRIGKSYNLSDGSTANKYSTPIGDVYDVLKAFEVTNPALQHLIKKALKVGKRGHKDIETDLQDIIDSAVRAKEIEGF